QRIRDEAHRFAITYHRQLRDKRMTRSPLDEVKGLGPTRKKRLLKELGSARSVSRASLDELKALPWLPDAVAEAAYEALHPVTPPGRSGNRDLRSSRVSIATRAIENLSAEADDG